jgi:branched-chain amino acid transport system substrate-binding protein
MVYDKPFTHDDHEAISPNVPVVGEVKGGRVVYAYEADKKGGSQLRSKQASSAN